MYYKLNNTVNSFLYAPKVTFFFKLGLSPDLYLLEGYMVESPNLKKSSHAQYFGILKKLTFLQEELFLQFTMQYLVILLLK